MDIVLEHYHRFFHGKADETAEIAYAGMELTLLDFVYPYWPGRRILATFGLSLSHSVECILVFPEGCGDVVETFGTTILFGIQTSQLRRDALIRFGVETGFVASTGKSAAFITVPYSVPHLEEFYTVADASIHILEAFFVTSAEADFIEGNGVDAFEKIASKADADLTDFARASLV